MKKIVALLTVTSMALYAQTFNVSDTSTLRAALQNAALNGEDDIIVLADGTYKTTDDGQGTFTYLDTEVYNLTLIGSSRENVILSGDSQNQILNYKSHVDSLLRIEKLSFIDGYASNRDNYYAGHGGALSSTYNVDVVDCNLSNNRSNRDGGAIYANKVSVTDSIFDGNTAGVYPESSWASALGGGFHTNEFGNITNSQFINNTASTSVAAPSGGGGFYAKVLDNSVISKIENSTFLNNVVNGNQYHGDSGGGFSILQYGGVSFELINSTFTNNTASGWGGGFYVAMSNITILNSTFNNNHSGLGGGGAKLQLAGIIENSEFIGNIANTKEESNGADKYGGGGLDASSQVTITNSLFKDNHALGFGGAIKAPSNNSYGTTITNTQFINNSADFGGGALFIQNLYLSNSIFSRNSTGIMYTDYTTHTVDNPSIIKNSLFLENNDSIIEPQISVSSNAIVYIKNSYLDLANVSVQKLSANNIFSGVTLGFSDAINDDYHLTLASDFIDAGTNEFADKFIKDGVNTLATDYEENNRTVGANMDIGIYEYSVTNPTINSFTYSGLAQEYSELLFDVNYTLVNGRTIASVEFDYYNDGNYVPNHNQTYINARTYTAKVKVTDSAGESSVRELDIFVEEIPYEDMTDAQKLMQSIDPTHYTDISGIINTSISDAELAGIQYVQDNLTEFSLYDDVYLNNAIQETIESCRINPNLCGISPSVVIIPL